MTSQNSPKITDNKEADTRPVCMRGGLEIVAFSAGAIVMVFEIVGARLIAPYLGTSTYVWTSIIGIILASLSLGYWIGGRIADARPSTTTLARIVLLSGFGVIYSLLFKDLILPFLQAAVPHLGWGSVIASLLLFTPGSVLLGMVMPIAVRLKMDDVAHSGQTVGTLNAISTFGSIVGTFAAGFFLIPWIGSERIMITLAVILWILAVLIHPRIVSSVRHAAFFGVGVTLALVLSWDVIAAEEGVFEKDTPYSYVKVYETTHPSNGLPLTVLQLNTEMHSGRYANGDPSLAFDYTRYYHLVRHFHPDPERTLMLGGGAMSFPLDFIRTYASATIDVVEIDPELPDIARRFFDYDDPARIRLVIDDARVFVARSTERWDAIFGDAFTSYYSLPYHLATREATEEMARSLADDGVLITNVIGSLEGPSSLFLKAEYATYATVFPHVYVVPVSTANERTLQNIMLIGSKKPMPPVTDETDTEIVYFLRHLLPSYDPGTVPVLTDDHAPVDHYMSALLRRS